MKKLPPFRLALASAALLAFLPCATLAQLPKIFVASFGNDASDGTRNSPKRNFQAAHNAVAAGGQIVVLDTAGYGSLNITKSLAVTVPPGVNGFITGGAGGAAAIFIDAGSSGVVSLRGLIVEIPPGNGADAITVASVGSLNVENCVLRNSGPGLNFALSSAAKLYVSRTTFRGSDPGLVVQSNGGALFATVNDCRFERCGTALFAFVWVASGSSDVSVSSCVFSGNTTAIDSELAGALVRVSDCAITGNGTGIVANNGGQVLSRGNNTLEKNPSGNTFPGTYSAR